MSIDVYKELAEALDRLPDRFPHVKSGIEIEIVKKAFTPEEAQTARVLSGIFETAEEIAEKAGMPLEKAKKLLDGMAYPERPGRGRVHREIIDGVPKYALVNYVPLGWGRGEFVYDKDMGKLLHDYFRQGAFPIMRIKDTIAPGLRVVPTKKALAMIPAEQVPKYDDLRKVIEEADWCSVNKCNCRLNKKIVGIQSCDFPIDTCLAFCKSDVPIPEGLEVITKEEAIKIVDKVEELGMIHRLSNIKEGSFNLCNCCSCCCWGLTAPNNYQLPPCPKSNYIPVVIHDICSLCGKCRNICQVYACHIIDGKVKIDYDKCLGCGACVTSCPLEAITFKIRPESKRIEPYENMKDREEAFLQGLQARGPKSGLRTKMWKP